MSKRKKPETIRQRHILDLLKRRIGLGAYLNGLPAERELAEEIGVARMTARKALMTLEEEGIATRLPTGRLVLSDSVAPKKNISLLVPSLGSHGITAWCLDASAAARKLGCHVRVIYYESYYDLTLMDTFQKSDGVFFIARAEETPRWVMRALQQHPRAVVLETDMSELGLPSINFFTSSMIHRLLNHLLDQGHSAVDCVNGQGHSTVIDRRIEKWQEWCAMFNVQGELIDAANLSSQRRIKILREYFARPDRTGSAVVCTALGAAQDLIRAAADQGLTVGKDLSICLMDGERRAARLFPSITALERPSSTRYLTVCMEWMLSPNAVWQGPLLMDTENVELFIGETTKRR